MHGRIRVGINNRCPITSNNPYVNDARRSGNHDHDSSGHHDNYDCGSVGRRSSFDGRSLR